MDPWLLPKVRPTSSNDSPACQRRHISVLCSAESLTRLPCVINTTFREMIHIRWCCTDRLRPPGFSASSGIHFKFGPLPRGRIAPLVGGSFGNEEGDG